MKRKPKDDASAEGADVESGAAGKEGADKPLKERAQAKLTQVKEEIQERDPVKMGRCHFGTLAFSMIGVAGFVFLGVGIAEEDVWEIITASFLEILCGYTVIFLGGDPCLMDAFRKQLNLFHKENLRFKESNDQMEGKLKDLSGVTDDLEDVRKKMGADLGAAERLLADMERFSALQTVSAVVNQFFASDWDNSGSINGDEAQIFLPQLEALWALVPNFNVERLIAHVREHGLTLQQLSTLLHYLVADDRDGCAEELERIMAEGNPKSSRSLNADGREVRVSEGAPQAQLEEKYEETGVSAPFWLTNAIAEDRKAKKDQVLNPIVECGPFVVWSILHAVLMLATVASLVFFVASWVVLEFSNIAAAFIGVSLSAGLMAASRLLEVLRALRVEVGLLKKENDRLEVNHEELAKQVAHLGKLKKGFDVLQAQCSGDVEQARYLITKSNTNTKMSAMAVITRFFRDTDMNRNQTIDADEVESFIQRLTLAFGSVESFDAEKMRTLATGLTVRELKSLVDVIVNVEGPPPPPEPVAEAAQATAEPTARAEPAPPVETVAPAHPNEQAAGTAHASETEHITT